MNNKALSVVVAAVLILVVAAVAGFAGYSIGLQQAPPSPPPTKPEEVAPPAPAEKVEPLKIGFVSTLTGVAASSGAHMLHGAQLAVEQINARGGILGRPIELIVEDQNDKTDMAIAAAKRFVEEGVYAAVGFFWSGHTAAMQPELIKGKIISIFDVSSSIKLLEKVRTDYENYKYFFRLLFNDSAIGAYSIPFLTDLVKAKSYYLIAEDFGWAHEVASTINELSAPLGIKALGEDFFAADVVDYSSVAAKIGTLNPDVVIIIMSGENGVAAVRDLRANPATSKIPIFFPYSGRIGEPESLRSLEEAQPGSTQYLVIAEHGLPDLPMTKKTLPFARAYRAKFGHDPLMAWSAPPYDSIWVLYDAILRANTFDKDAVIRELENTDFIGVRGRIRFTEDHDFLMAPGFHLPIYMQVVDLEFKVIWPENLATASFIDPRQA